jgi:hypothetical protein
MMEVVGLARPRLFVASAWSSRFAPAANEPAGELPVGHHKEGRHDPPDVDDRDHHDRVDEQAERR